MISTWRLNNKVDDEQEKYLKTHNSVAPAVYGLGKLHKKEENENMPLRSVVATMQSPTYKLSKVKAEFFGKIETNSPHHIKGQLAVRKRSEKRQVTLWTQVYISRRNVIVYEYSDSTLYQGN